VNPEVVGPTVNRWLVGIREIGVTACFCVATINLLAVLVTGGYRLHLGPIRVAALHLQGPLLLFLVTAMATVWLRSKRWGSTAAVRWQSPLSLFLGVVFIYSLNGRALTAGGDSIPATYLPLSLLRELDFDLDEFPFLYEG
jgi:hypothetical protein